MSTLTTKFGIGDIFYTFDPVVGVITPHVVVGIGISAIGGVNMTPEITYTAVRTIGTFSEPDCLASQEALDIGNAWLAERSITMFTSAGL